MQLFVTQYYQKSEFKWFYDNHLPDTTIHNIYSYGIVNTYECCLSYLETWVWMNHTICWLHLKFFMQIIIYSSLLVNIFFSCLRTVSVRFTTTTARRRFTRIFFSLKIIFNTVVELDFYLGKIRQSLQNTLSNPSTSVLA